MMTNVRRLHGRVSQHLPITWSGQLWDGPWASKVFGSRPKIRVESTPLDLRHEQIMRPSPVAPHFEGPCTQCRSEALFAITASRECHYIAATMRWHILWLKCTKSNFGWSSTLHPLQQLTVLYQTPSWTLEREEDGKGMEGWKGEQKGRKNRGWGNGWKGKVGKERRKDGVYPCPCPWLGTWKGHFWLENQT